VRLTRAGTVVTQPLVVVRDARLPSSVTDTDLVRQYELARDVQALRVRIASGLHQAGSLREQVAALREKATGDAAAALDALRTSIDLAAGPAVRSPAEERFGTFDDDATSLRRLASSLADLQASVESADSAPTRDARTAFVQRSKLAAQGLARWQAVLTEGVARANARLAAASLAGLTVR